MTVNVEDSCMLLVCGIEKIPHSIPIPHARIEGPWAMIRLPSTPVIRKLVQTTESQVNESRYVLAAIKKCGTRLTLPSMDCIGRHNKGVQSGIWNRNYHLHSP